MSDMGQLVQYFKLVMIVFVNLCFRAACTVNGDKTNPFIVSRTTTANGRGRWHYTQEGTTHAIYGSLSNYDVENIIIV